MKRNTIIIFLLLAYGILYANDIYHIKNNELYKQDDTLVVLNEYDYVKTNIRWEKHKIYCEN